MKRGGYPTLVVGGAALLVAVWVASTSAVDLLPSALSSQHVARLPSQPNPRRPHAGPPGQHRVANLETPTTLVVAGYVVMGVMVAALLWFLVSAAVQKRRDALPRRRLTEATDDANAFGTLDIPPEILATAERQLLALRTGSPRNAIVACWMELERTCHDSGFPRIAAETSTEFTTRILAHYALGQESVGALARLYREARFSEHQLDEEHRERALTALENVLSTLRQSRTVHADAGAAP